MPALKITKKRSVELVSQLNYLFSTNKVDAVDRNPVAELAFAELIAGTLPACGEGQDLAQFYRGTLLDGVRDFVDQVVEVVQMNQEQCLLAVWASYSYRMRCAQPRNPGDVRPNLAAYSAQMPARHANVMAKYPNITENYWGLASIIYVQ